METFAGGAGSVLAEHSPSVCQHETRNSDVTCKCSPKDLGLLEHLYEPEGQIQSVLESNSCICAGLNCFDAGSCQAVVLTQLKDRHSH